MGENQAPSIFKLLSNDLRWQLLKTLSQSDLRVQELTEFLGQPQNLVSYHLQKLHYAGLVIEHQSIADGREIYYGINLNQIQSLFRITQETLHPGLTSNRENKYHFPPLRVLFLCTHNSARSQMAEGFLRVKSQSQIETFSAGPDPLHVNPMAIAAMEEFNIDIRDQQSKSQNQFLNQTFDFVITVCDRARETCPIFPGKPVMIHWSIADPTEANGPLEAQRQIFRATALELNERIDFFLAGIYGQSKLKANHEE